MASLINADTSDGIKITSDTSGEIKLQSAGADIATVDSSGITMAAGKTLPAAALTGTLPAGTSVISAGTSVASTSGTSIDFTSIPSWVKRITVMFSGVSTSGTSVWQLQVGSGSIQTSGYTQLGTNIGQNASPTATTGFAVAVFVAAADVRSGIAVLTNVANNSWVLSSMTGATVPNSLGWCNGNVSLSATLDRIRITTVNGTDTFDAGSINILYE